MFYAKLTVIVVVSQSKFGSGRAIARLDFKNRIGGFQNAAARARAGGGVAGTLAELAGGRRIIVIWRDVGGTPRPDRTATVREALNCLVSYLTADLFL